jgi:sugar transferase (PEP-CTERM system associated)
MISSLTWRADRSRAAVGAADAATAVACFYLAYFARYADLSGPATTLAAYLPQAALYASAVMLSMVSIGVYEHEARASLRVALIRAGAGLVLAFILLAVVIYLAPGLHIWRSGLLIALPATLAGLLLVRLLMLRDEAQRALRKRVLVLGDSELVEEIDCIERARPMPSFEVTARVDVKDPRLADQLWLRRQAEAGECQEIVVATSERRGRLPVAALLECKLAGVQVSDYHDFCERVAGRVDVDRLYPAWLVFSNGFGNTQLDQLGKRLLDVVVAATGLVLASPILLAAAVAIKLDDGGPVLYRQARTGRGGAPFEFLKFRSMRTDAERAGAQWARENDPRVTRVGRLIRRTRVDELPQLLNVLRGEMSLVGPRPERPVFVDQLAAQLPYFRERHRMKPGIAGWAQLNFQYAASLDDARVKLHYDMYYLKNWSLALDLAILTLTLRVVIWGQGVR